MVATPLTGKLSDKYGRRRFFMMGFLGSMCGFLCIATWKSIYGCLVGRAIGGLFGASMPLAGAYISDLDLEPKVSGKYRAYLGSVFMSALVFAPGFGGGLSKFGNAFPFYVSATLAGIGFVLGLLYLDEPGAKAKKAKGDDEEKSPEEQARLSQISKSHTPLLRLLYLVGAVWAFGFRCFIMIGGLWVIEKFGWTATEFGFMASLSGSLGICTNLLLYSKIQGRLGRHGTAILGSAVAATGWLVVNLSAPNAVLGVGESAQWWLGPGLFLVGYCIASVGNSLYNTSQSALIARYADKSAQGSSFGLAQSFMSAAGFVAPVVGGWLMGIDLNLNTLVTFASFVLICGLLNLALFLNRRLPEHARQAASQSARSLSAGGGAAEEDPMLETEMTKQSPLTIAMDPSGELELLRERVGALEAENASLLERLLSFGGGGGEGEGEGDADRDEAMQTGTLASIYSSSH